MFLGGERGGGGSVSDKETSTAERCSQQGRTGISMRTKWRGA